LKQFDRALDAIQARIQELASLEAQVGWFPESVYEDGTSVASVALIHEHGAPAAGIPPRPFIRPTIDDESAQWGSILSAGAKKVLAGKASAHDVMSAIAMTAAADVQANIAAVNEPELSAATKANRTRNGRNYKPLQDTGKMIASVQGIVVKRNEP